MNGILNAGGGKNWTFPKNDTAGSFKSNFSTYKEAYKAASDKGLTDEMVDFGSQGADKVNKFLIEKGFPDVQLDAKSVPPDGIAAATTFSIEDKWKNPGNPMPGGISLGGTSKSVPGFKMEHVEEGTKISEHANPIFKLETTNGTSVYVTRYDSTKMGTPSHLHEQALKFSKALQGGKKFETPNGIAIPMVDLRQSGDLAWLQGASSTSSNGTQITISQAKYGIAFQMNDNGFKAEGAAATTATRSMSYNPYIIDGSFLAWVQDKEGNIFFSTGVTEEFMKKPNLEIKK